MALESRIKLTADNFSPQSDLIEVFSKKAGVVGVINPSQIASPPSGGAGAIQFSDGSAFASDASNLFWDDTNNYLGIGTNTPSVALEVQNNARIRGGLNLNGSLSNSSTGIVDINGLTYVNAINGFVGVGVSTPSARLHARGSGSTSATTSLLVQNSAGNSALTIKDDLSGIFTGIIDFQNNVNFRGANFTQSTLNMRFVVPGATKTFLINADYGDTNAPSAILEVQSTTKGFLPPRMTTTQKNAIATPAAGLMVFDTDLGRPCFYNGAWVTL